MRDKRRGSAMNVQLETIPAKRNQPGLCSGSDARVSFLARRQCAVLRWYLSFNVTRFIWHCHAIIIIRKCCGGESCRYRKFQTVIAWQWSDWPTTRTTGSQGTERESQCGVPGWSDSIVWITLCQTLINYCANNCDKTSLILTDV